MKLHNDSASIFVPDGQTQNEALQRITHLGIGAHADDLEFMAFHGIAACYGSASDWFGGVTCTNGAGSVRTGAYADFTGEKLHAERKREQDKAAVIGQYAAMIQLDYSSSEVKNATGDSLKNDLKEILDATRPRIVYTHNLADKHETHLGVAVAAIQAMREMLANERPQSVYGCEVWRGLDWMPDEAKVIHDVSAHEDLATSLIGVFDSQISGGKRYDLAILGRRRANATFLNPHAKDPASMVSLAMDLTPLIADPSRNIIEFVAGFIAKFEADVRCKLARRLGLPE